MYLDDIKSYVRGTALLTSELQASKLVDGRKKIKFSDI